MNPGIKDRFQKLNGWQRIWFVLTLLVWVPGILIAFGTTDNLLGGFDQVTKARATLKDAQATVSNLEVDCKLNDKKADAEMDKIRPRWNVLNDDFIELSAEKERLSKSSYSWSPQGQSDLRKIDAAMDYIMQQRDALTNTPVLKLQDKCLNADSHLGFSQRNYDVAVSNQYDPLVMLAKHLFVATLVAGIFSAVLYALGFCIAWIVKGFKNK